MAARDALDELRDKMPASRSSSRNWPTNDQRVELFRVTKTFFDTTYSMMSHISSVIVRFSGVFGTNSLDTNSKLTRWALQNLLSIDDSSFAELERARMYRALVNHPQQFAAMDWSTVTTSRNFHPHVMLHGPRSRNNKIPPGATSEHEFDEIEDHDWVFFAPDEVSVTNVILNGAAEVFAYVVMHTLPGSTFRARSLQADVAFGLVYANYVPGVRHDSPFPIRKRVR